MKLMVLPMLAVALAVATVPAAAKPKPKTPVAAPMPQPQPEDWIKLDPQNVLVIDTSKGRIYLELSPELAPESVKRVKQLAREHFYDGLKFHRVIDKFMAQTGDPLGTGAGGSTYPNVKAEFSFRRDSTLAFIPGPTPTDGDTVGYIGVNPVITQPDALMDMTKDHKVMAWGRFCPGTAGMARAGDPDSANSQFFLMRQSKTDLEKQYTPFGRVVSGLSVVRALNVGEPPLHPDIMTKVQVLADLPADQRPQVLVLDPRSKAFSALVAKARDDEGPDFSVCDVETPSQVKGGDAAAKD